MTSKYRIQPMQDSGILYVYSIRDVIQVDPPYQRMSDIWTLDKQQLFIDSIINHFDIPKLYFHEFIPFRVIGKNSYEYAIIDGKQRLQALWKFINNEFPLPDDFEYLDDKKVKLGGKTYSDIANKYPIIKTRFDQKSLPIITIQTDDIEFIEDMFSRLNEAVPLSAPEKRNAFGGPLPELIRKLSAAAFFTKKLPFTNSRYRHYDLATKFLYFERQNKFVDTKKIHLDAFVKGFRKKTTRDVMVFYNRSLKICRRMSKIFTSKDPLLTSVGTVVLYYFVFRSLEKQEWAQNIDRSVFARFEVLRSENRKLAEKEQEADVKLLEYDRLSTSPNDANAIKYRYEILVNFLKKELGS